MGECLVGCEREAANMASVSRKAIEVSVVALA